MRIISLFVYLGRVVSVVWRTLFPPKDKMYLNVGQSCPRCNSGYLRVVPGMFHPGTDLECSSCHSMFPRKP